MSTCKGLPVLALALCLSLPGCQNPNRSRTIDTGAAGPREVTAPQALVAGPQSPISDVPIPTGFQWDPSESRSVEAPGLRWVEHRYMGKAHKWELGRFFQRQMPLAQWRADSSRMSQGTLRLYFSKPGERCEIVISDGSWSGMNVDVIIFPVRRDSASGAVTSTN